MRFASPARDLARCAALTVAVLIGAAPLRAEGQIRPGALTPGALPPGQSQPAQSDLAQPDLAQPDLTGRVIDLIIPFSEGGGSDTWARFYGPLIQRHLPGAPEIRVINESGSGGTRGSNIFAARARPDGLTLLGTSTSSLFAALLGDFRVRYDIDDWQVLMATPTGGVVYVSAETGITSWEDLSALPGQRLVFASQGATSLDLVPMLAFRLLGWEVNYVFGYTGRHEGLAALRQGDVNIDHQTTPAYLRNVAPMVAAGEAIPLMSWGIIDAEGRVQRDPTFPDLPTVEELYERLHGAPPSGVEYEAYRAFATAGFSAQKMLVLPPGVSEEMRALWSRAIAAALNDPEHEAEAAEQLGAYTTLLGEDAQRLAYLATRIDPAARRSVLEMLAAEYAIRLSE